MKWRCEWCGKPHERNDPPCDNCGHHSFEKAVVPMAPEEDVEAEYVWVCEACERVHPRNTPPCSRCGNMDFERRTQEYLDPGEVESTGYLDVLEPVHLVLAAIAIALVAVLGLGAAGVVDLPGFGGPTVSDVPGSADDVAGLSLSDVEDEYVAGLDERRADSGIAPFERPEKLDELATYYNQRRVKADYGNGDQPDPGQVYERFDYRCSGTPVLREYPPPAFVEDVSVFENESELAAVMSVAENQRLVEDYDEIGVDAHAAPDGTLYVAVFAC